MVDKRWKIYTSAHDCPVCAGEIMVQYDVGPDPDNFYLVSDEWECEFGHSVSHGVLETWTENDREAYGRKYVEEYDSEWYYFKSGGR